MEKKNNGFFKAVSIISLTIAIIYSIALVLFVIAFAMDFQGLVESFSIIVLEDGTSIVAEGNAIVKAALTIAFVCLYFGAFIAFYFVAFAKIKKYSSLTDAEAKTYSGKIIAWVVVMFIFGGIINAVLMLIGYLTVTEKQVQLVAEKMKKIANEQEDENNDIDMDLMINRLEKLNKIKEMNGVTDEEYEILRKKIVKG